MTNYNQNKNPLVIFINKTIYFLKKIREGVVNCIKSDEKTNENETKFFYYYIVIQNGKEKSQT